jgi:hypothetical protein
VTQPDRRQPPPFLRLPSSSSSQRRRSLFRSLSDSCSARRRRRWRCSGSGSQRRRGSPRFGGGVSAPPPSPFALRPRLRFSAHRPATLRARLLLPSYSGGQSTASGSGGCTARRVRPSGSRSQQPLLHQGGRAALVPLIPQTKRDPSA